ncbi:MAG: NOB1 family endonuclease, partial [Candidatus Thorarchaeota archaeon]
MSKLYVLDTGGLLTTWTDGHLEEEFITTSSIIDELQNRPSKMRAETLISAGRLKEESANANALQIVSDTAKKMGDLKVLSESDIEIIALALSKKESSYDVVLVSTDLAVLNTASSLDLEIHDPKGRMAHQIKWHLKCPACDHTERKASSDLECPICGTTMRRKAVSRR